MTTIVYRDGVMACDGRVTSGHGEILDSAFRKIVRLKNGNLLGVAGSAADMENLEEFLDSGKPEEKLYLNEITIAIYVNWKTGKMVSMTSGGNRKIASPYYAIGSGAPFARTAMDLGLSAVEAVKMAIKRDAYSGGKIRALKLNP